MEKIIAFCGIICSDCPAFLATHNDDDDARKKTAELWAKQFNVDLKPEDINCKGGCPSEGENVFSYCKVCQIRKCGQDKGLQNCAHCEEYVCEKLGDFFNHAPGPKDVLDGIRANL